MILIAAAAVAAPPWPLALGAVDGRPQRGDRLVDEDAEGTPVPLRPSDLRPGKPMLAFPFDAAKQIVRNDARANKVVLMRFAEAELDAQTRERAAGGVLAFSALCTHQACDVKTWLAKEKVLVCFCHASKFALLEGGRVASGPATRSLPFLPLVLDGDQLVVAGALSAEPGASA